MELLLIGLVVIFLSVVILVFVGSIILGMKIFGWLFRR